MSIIALIPACNEPAIGETVDSVLRQTLSVDTIVVVTNNCSDGGLTAQTAREHGAHVLDLGKITGKKAGALNQGLAYIAEQYPDVELVLQMDADTVLEEHFVERTAAVMDYNGDIGGLCASFIGQDKKASGFLNSFLVWAQQQEFVRFHDVQLSTQTSVLSGTASMLRYSALHQLVAQRGYVWDEECIVEDYETTKALQDSGWLCMSHRSFVAYTDVMTTWKELLNQRLRWQCGTLQVVFRDYRGKRCVRLDTWRQRWAYGAFLPHVGGYAMVIYALATYGIRLGLFTLLWILLGLYHGWSTRSLGWRKAFLAAMVIPLEVYNLFRYYWMYRGWRRLHTVPASDQDW